MPHTAPSIHQEVSKMLSLMSAGDIEKIAGWGGNHWWLWAIKLAILVAALIVLWFRSTERIPATDLALKLRFGDIVRFDLIDPETGKKIRQPRETRFKFLNRILPGKKIGLAKVYGPGLHLMWPGPDKFHKVDIRQRSLELKPQTIRAKVGHEVADSVVRFHVDRASLETAVLLHLDLDTHLTKQAQARQTWLAAHGIPTWEIPEYVLNGIQDRLVPTATIIPKFAIVGLATEAANCGARIDDFYIDRLQDTEATQNAKAFADTGFKVNFLSPLLLGGESANPAK